MAPSSDAASRRRNTRQRREYLYRKSLEGKDRSSYEKKRVVREALAAGKPLPTEVRAGYDALKAEVDAGASELAIFHESNSLRAGEMVHG